MVVERRNPSFIPIRCRCGRSLRAKWDQVGTEIRCWDCHQMVAVLKPKSRVRVASELLVRLQQTTEGPNFIRLASLAAVIAGALSIPDVGVGVASVVLVFLAAAYGDTIQRGDVTPKDAEVSWRTLPRPRSPLEAIACALLVAGTVVPLWVFHAGVNSSPHLDRVGLLILGVTLVVMPAAMVLIYGRRPGEPSGYRRGISRLRRHPGVLAMAVLIVPAGFVATEAWLDFILYVEGGLPFFALDHMPMPGKPWIYIGIPHYNSVDFRMLPQGRFIRGYFDAVGKGYSFVGAMPPSLSLPTRAGLNPSVIQIIPFGYAAIRFVMVTLIVTCLLASFSIQARWLGYLTQLDRVNPPDLPKPDLQRA